MQEPKVSILDHVHAQKLSALLIQFAEMEIAKKEIPVMGKLVEYTTIAKKANA